jgi:hypothetical protein
MPKNNQFTLRFPEGWKETTVYSFEGPHDSGVQHNLVATATPIDKKADLVAFAKQQLEVSTQALPAFEMISEQGVTLPSGLPAYIVVYRYSPAENVTYFQKQYFVKAEQKAFIFTSTFSKKTLKTIAKEVDHIVASFGTVQDNDEE